MNDPFEGLKKQWKDAKTQGKQPSVSSKELIEKSTEKLKSSRNMHRGNIAILLITLIGISAFFMYVAPLQEILSLVGISLMLGGLSLRILIEIQSAYRSTKIDMSETATEVNEEFIRYYTYRKQIHGSITISILLAYTIGFYLLTPEFSQYFTTNQVILMDVSYLGAAAIFGFSIRKAIRSEMKMLNEVLKLRDEVGKVE
ncbi:hypothetical protein [Ekhidna sp.]